MHLSVDGVIVTGLSRYGLMCCRCYPCAARKPVPWHTRHRPTPCRNARHLPARHQYAPARCCLKSRTLSARPPWLLYDAPCAVSVIIRSSASDLAFPCPVSPRQLFNARAASSGAARFVGNTVDLGGATGCVASAGRVGPVGAMPPFS
jgi:hypothetical protein